MYEDILDFCVEHKLTPNQFICLHLLVNKLSVKLRKYSLSRPDRKFLTAAEKSDLIAREYLIPTETGKFAVNEKFKRFYFEKYQGGNEIYELYPGFRQTKEGMFPLTSMDMNEFRAMYYNRINGSLKEHEEILKDVAYANEHNLLSFGIKKFVQSEAWRKIRKLRLNDDTTIISSTNTTEHDF